MTAFCQKLTLTGALIDTRKRRDWSWQRVHPIADRIAEGIVGIVLGCLIVLVVLAGLR